MAKPTYEFVTKFAIEEDKSWSCRDRLYFHAFNPRGLLAQKREADARITKAVDAGALKTGAILAYGSFNDFHPRQIMKLAMAKRFEVIATSVAIRGMEDDLAQTIRVAEEAGF